MKTTPIVLLEVECLGWDTQRGQGLENHLLEHFCIKSCELSTINTKLYILVEVRWPCG